MKKIILIKIGMLVEIDESELDTDFNQLDKLTNELSEKIDELLGYDEESNLGMYSTKSIELDEKTMNCGRCAVCNSWVTDRERPNYIPELNNGAFHNGKLLCDLHLPKGHYWAF